LNRTDPDEISKLDWKAAKYLKHLADVRAKQQRVRHAFQERKEAAKAAAASTSAAAEAADADGSSSDSSSSSSFGSSTVSSDLSI